VRAEDVLAGLPTPRPTRFHRFLLTLERALETVLDVLAYALVEVVEVVTAVVPGWRKG